MTSKEALKRLKQETAPATYMPDFDKEECINVIAKDLEKLEQYENIEKSLKALEIIIKKDVQIYNLKYYIATKQAPRSYYNWIYESNENMQLSKEEFDLLKEVLL